MSDINSKTKNLSSKIDTLQTALKSLSDNADLSLNINSSPYLNSNELTKQLLGDGPGKSANLDFISKLLDTLIQSTGGGPDATKSLIKKIIKKISNDAPRITKIVIEELIRSLNCETDLSLNGIEAKFSAEGIDMFDILKVSPSSTEGRLMYEKKSTSDNSYPISTNKFIFERINGAEETYVSHNGLPLFDLGYDQFDEEYTLKFKDITVSDFVSNYYSSFELFNTKELMTDLMDMLFGMISVDISTKRVNSFAELNKFTEAIAALCSDFYESDSLIKEGLIDTVSSKDEELSFDFDDSDTRYIEENFNLKVKKLYRLADCGNYEAEMNPDLIIDMLLDLDSDSISDNEVVDNFLNNLGSHVDDSGFDIPTVNLNFNTDIFKQIPKTIISKVMGPKTILPFIALKSGIDSVTDEAKNVTDFVNNNKTFMTRISKRVFDMYKEELFKEIKKVLTQLITQIIKKIATQQFKSRYALILALITALNKFMKNDLSSCAGIIRALMSLLNLRTGIPLGVPFPLLYGAYVREGASSTRSFTNGIENLQKIGYNVGDLPDGSPNKHVLQHKAMSDGLMKEMTENGVIQFVSQPATGVHPLGPVVTPFVTGKGVILTTFD